MQINPNQRKKVLVIIGGTAIALVILASCVLLLLNKRSKDSTSAANNNVGLDDVIIVVDGEINGKDEKNSKQPGSEKESPISDDVSKSDEIMDHGHSAENSMHSQAIPSDTTEPAGEEFHSPETLQETTDETLPEAQQDTEISTENLESAPVMASGFNQRSLIGDVNNSNVFTTKATEGSISVDYDKSTKKAPLPTEIKAGTQEDRRNETDTSKVSSQNAETAELFHVTGFRLVDEPAYTEFKAFFKKAPRLNIIESTRLDGEETEEVNSGGAGIGESNTKDTGSLKATSTIAEPTGRSSTLLKKESIASEKNETDDNEDTQPPNYDEKLNAGTSETSGISLYCTNMHSDLNLSETAETSSYQTVIDWGANSSEPASDNNQQYASSIKNKSGNDENMEKTNSFAENDMNVGTDLEKISEDLNVDDEQVVQGEDALKENMQSDPNEKGDDEKPVCGDNLESQPAEQKVVTEKADAEVKNLDFEKPSFPIVKNTELKTPSRKAEKLGTINNRRSRQNSTPSSLLSTENIPSTFVSTKIKGSQIPNRPQMHGRKEIFPFSKMSMSFISTAEDNKPRKSRTRSESVYSEDLRGNMKLKDESEIVQIENNKRNRLNDDVERLSRELENLISGKAINTLEWSKIKNKQQIVKKFSIYLKNADVRDIEYKTRFRKARQFLNKLDSSKKNIQMYADQRNTAEILQTLEDQFISAFQIGN